MRVHLSRRTRYLLAFGLQLALAPWLVHNWDGFVFERTLRDFFAGVSPYATGAASPWWTFIGSAWPAPNQWYAYPPLALLAMALTTWPAHLLDAAPWAWRVGFKLPMIAGTLLLASVVHAWSREIGASAKTASRAETTVLFSPFFVILSGVWGMFDAAFVAILLAAILMGIRGRHAAAGALFGTSMLLKIFPAFLAPALVVASWRRFGPRATLTALGTAAGVVALVSLPFLLESPAGFLNQVLLIHLQRPAQGYALISLLGLPEFFNLYLGTSMPTLPGRLIGAFGLLGILIVIAVSAWAATRVTSKLGLLRLLGITFGAILLVSKVVNDQYLALPLAILAILAGSGALERRGFIILSWGAAAATLLSGWHFITFIPPDVAIPLFGTEGAARIWGAYPESYHPIWAQIPNVLGILALVPIFVFALLYIWRLTRHHMSASERRRIGTSVAAVTILATLLVSTLMTGDDAPALTPSRFDEVTWGVSYQLDYLNPAADPSVRFGSWLLVRDAPLEGYVSPNGAYFEHELANIHRAGFDFVIVDVTPRTMPYITAFAHAAERRGIPFAIRYDPDAPHANPGAYASAARSPAQLAADGRAVEFTPNSDCESPVPTMPHRQGAAPCDAPFAHFLSAASEPDDLAARVNASRSAGANWIIFEGWNAFSSDEAIQPSMLRPHGRLAAIEAARPT